MSDRRFWIRKDRENYFLGGVIIACCIGGFVSSYWHFTDRITVRQNITINTNLTPEGERRKLREVQYTPSKLRIGNTQYYRLEQGPSMAVPEMDDEGE